VPINKNWLITF